MKRKVPPAAWKLPKMLWKLNCSNRRTRWLRWRRKLQEQKNSSRKHSKKTKVALEAKTPRDSCIRNSFEIWSWSNKWSFICTGSEISGVPSVGNFTHQGVTAVKGSRGCIYSVEKSADEPTAKMQMNEFFPPSRWIWLRLRTGHIEGQGWRQIEAHEHIVICIYKCSNK